MPASSHAAKIASTAISYSDMPRPLLNLVWPMPAIAALSRMVRLAAHVPPASVIGRSRSTIRRCLRACVTRLAPRCSASTRRSSLRRALSALRGVRCGAQAASRTPERLAALGARVPVPSSGATSGRCGCGAVRVNTRRSTAWPSPSAARVRGAGVEPRRATCGARTPRPRAGGAGSRAGTMPALRAVAARVVAHRRERQPEVRQERERAALEQRRGRRRRAATLSTTRTRSVARRGFARREERASRAARAPAQRVASGQASQRGARGRQTVSPSSISAWFQSPGRVRSSSRSASAPCGSPRASGRGRQARRDSTRTTFASSAACGRS